MARRKYGKHVDRHAARLYEILEPLGYTAYPQLVINEQYARHGQQATEEHSPPISAWGNRPLENGLGVGDVWNAYFGSRDPEGYIEGDFTAREAYLAAVVQQNQSALYRSNPRTKPRLRRRTRKT